MVLQYGNSRACISVTQMSTGLAKLFACFFHHTEQNKPISYKGVLISP